MNNRRNFLKGIFCVGTGLAAAPTVFARHQGHYEPGMQMGGPPSRLAAGAPVPLVTPDVADLPWQMEGGVKVFHLVAEPVKREIFPGRIIDLWGYNGTAPGPTIQVTTGDRVRIIVENNLPEPTSMHWHGFEIPVDQDGMPGISQQPIPPGGRYVYEFTVHQEGTFFYHSHMAMQEMLGMIGLFIMHPRRAYRPRVDHDFGFILQEYAILPNSSIPNTMSMEFNWLTMNGKSAPTTTPLIVKLGDRVRMRWVNLGMDHHPIHVHGHTFAVTGSEAGRQPETMWGPKNTVLVGVAEAVDVEFVANNPGDWMVHCHLPHHMMNQMSSIVGPMTRGGRGMPAGGGMGEGMGIVRQGNGTAEELGPSLGRGMGFGNDRQNLTTNSALSAARAQEAMQHQGMQHGGMAQLEVSPNANQVPGFPQDAFMAMHATGMEDMVAKPETEGLPKGWTQGMMGMMTLLRVLPPDKYKQIQALRLQQRGPQPMHHHHG